MPHWVPTVPTNAVRFDSPSSTSSNHPYRINSDRACQYSWCALFFCENLRWNWIFAVRNSSVNTFLPPYYEQKNILNPDKSRAISGVGNEKHVLQHIFNICWLWWLTGRWGVWSVYGRKNPVKIFGGVVWSVYLCTRFRGTAVPVAGGRPAEGLESVKSSKFFGRIKNIE